MEKVSGTKVLVLNIDNFDKYNFPLPMNEENVGKPENVFKNIELNRDVKSFWSFANCHKQEKNLPALGVFFFFFIRYFGTEWWQVE